MMGLIKYTSKPSKGLNWSPGRSGSFHTRQIYCRAIRNKEPFSVAPALRCVFDGIEDKDVDKEIPIL